MALSDDPVRGIGLRILSGLLFTGMVVFVKLASDAVPLGEIVFFRSFFALIPLVVFLWIRSEFPGGLSTKRPWSHLARSGLGALAMFASFATIARLPTAEATLIGHLSPVFMALAGALLLSERLTVWRVGGIGLGLLGVVALVAPDLGGTAFDQAKLVGYGLGLLTAVLTALALIMVRSLGRTESPGAIAFYFVVASMIGGVVTIPWGWLLPDGQTLFFLVFAGLFGGLAHIAMTLAFQYAEASRLAPFEYVALVWPVLADLLIFNLPFNTAFFIAVPLVLGGAALAAFERRKVAPIVKDQPAE